MIIAYCHQDYYWDGQLNANRQSDRDSYPDGYQKNYPDGYPNSDFDRYPDNYCNIDLIEFSGTTTIRFSYFKLFPSIRNGKF